MSNRRILIAALLPALAAPQSNTAGNRMEINVERQAADSWRAIEPGTVLAGGDAVRFKFKSNFDGYLYVINYGTSGRRALLFPLEGAAPGANQVRAGQEYVIPPGAGRYRVAGPPGFDTIYWIVSPIELPMALPAEPAVPGNAPSRPDPTLIPRCDDEILRARGDCVDSRGGFQQVDEQRAQAPAMPKTSSRGLFFIRRQKTSVVSTPAKLTGPVMYEFRLAHR